MRAAEGRDARELVGSRVLEEHAFNRNSVIAAAGDAVRSHPVERGATQIDPARVVMAIFGLVAYDQDRAVLEPAAAQEGIHAVEHRPLVASLPFDVTLKFRPIHFPCWVQVWCN